MIYFTVPEGKEPTDAVIAAETERTFKAQCKAYGSMPGTAAQKKMWENEWKEDLKVSVRNRLRAKAGQPLDTALYDKVVDMNDCDIMTVEEWRESCEFGGFIDYDGFGYPARARRVEWEEGLNPAEYPMMVMEEAWIPMAPSLQHLVPKDATHINWFNR
jgi:cell wall assembly regulator SMI1